MTNEILIKLGVNGQAQVAAAFQQLVNGAAQLRSILLGLAGVGGIVAFTKSAIDAADQMGKLSQKTGILTESLSTLSYAAKLADVEQSELQNGLKFLAAELVKTGRGAESLETEILKLADEFQRMPDGAAKSQRAVELFGRAGTTMIPLLNEGADGIRRMQEEARALGVEISGRTAVSADQFNDNITRLETAFRGVFLQIASNLLPTLNSLSASLIATQRNAADTKETADRITRAFQYLATGVLQVYHGVNVLIAIIGAPVISQFNATGHIIQGFIDLLKSLAGGAMRTGAAILETVKAVGGLGDVMQKVIARDFAGALKSANDTFNKFVEKSKEIGDAYGGTLIDGWNIFKTTAEKVMASARAAYEVAWETMLDEGESYAQRYAAIWNDAAPKPQDAGSVVQSQGSTAGTGMKGGSNILEEINKAYQSALYSKQQLLDADYQRNLLRLNQEVSDEQDHIIAKIALDATYEEQKRILAEEGAKKRIAIQKSEEDAKRRLQQDFAGASADILGSMAQIARLYGEKGFAAWKAIAVAQAVISGANAVLLQLGSGDPYSAPFRAVAAGIAATAQVATILATQPSGYAAGGYTGAGPRMEVAGQVHRGEFVFSAPEVERIGVDNLNALHDGSIGIGSPGVSVGGPTIHNAILFSDSELRQFMKKSAVEQAVVNIVRMNKYALGIA